MKFGGVKTAISERFKGGILLRLRSSQDTKLVYWLGCLKKPRRMNMIGREVARIRFQQGLTQDALAARCQLAAWEIERGTLAKIESEIRQVTDFEVWQLATVLKVDVGQLFPTDIAKVSERRSRPRQESRRSDGQLGSATKVGPLYQ
jgi:transcriptional regulator with XRE-family HTH domain